MESELHPKHTCAEISYIQRKGGRTVSADNYMWVTRHPKGGFAAVMAFASSDEPPREATEKDLCFADFEDCLEWAQGQDAEYGVRWDRSSLRKG